MRLLNLSLPTLPQATTCTVPRLPYILPCLLLPLLLAIAAPTSAAGVDDDNNALSLADAAPVVKQVVSPWRVSTEASLGRRRQRYGVNDFNIGRLSLDAYYDGVLAPGWRLVFSDRLDRYVASDNTRSRTVNTLKEAYVSWHPPGDNIFDAGRVNARYGVGFGYNPTDFFRSNSIRSVVSIDPNSLRENRLGTVMLRGQTLLPGGSVSAIFAPRIENTRSNAPFSPDFGATNNRARWMLTASPTFSETFNPQFLLFGGAGHSPQGGVNLSALLNQATVGYVEWAGGSSATLYDRSRGVAGREAFRQRLATGLTYTTTTKMSLTGEYEYNGAGLNRDQWNTLGPTSLSSYFGYRNLVQDQLELPTRSALFFYGTWQDALVNHLDLRAMVRYNLADRSRLNWIEARYHFTHADLSLQLQHNGGNAFSEYGALPDRQVIQAVLTYYF